MGGITHDEPEGISVAAGENKELTYTFAEAGAMLAGCHLPGHYAGGRRAEISIEGVRVVAVTELAAACRNGVGALPVARPMTCIGN